ncbi:class I SAM-dependent methyltransferase [Microbacterium sulfonylureivorans]|uniref:class I SAM-dependent methyltransferase n=1 Tax=Microbacterium sulfonylureivorans TaxID=2486854 RepID=UPI000FDC6067|nr:class I SAM-dependent methyltransferase [Microbacterium sulfonylureivorans]
MVDTVRRAYSRRAAEYIDLLGSMEAVHPSDLQLVSAWADGLDGDVIDVGCGPGHWTNFLVERGVDARGVDAVPAFIAHARNSYPGVSFTLGSLESLDAATGSVSGVLAWYSLIHYTPESIRVPLIEMGRVLKPGGRLLIGYLASAAIEEYAHAVTPAWRWPVDALRAELDATGFDTVQTDTRQPPGERPQGSIIARRRDDR